MLALQERQAVDRAKALLMSKQGLSEQEAYRKLREVAMSKGMRIGEIARRMLDLADLII
jgi:response regulator NasT